MVSDSTRRLRAAVAYAVLSDSAPPRITSRRLNYPHVNYIWLVLRHPDVVDPLSLLSLGCLFWLLALGELMWSPYATGLLHRLLWNMSLSNESCVAKS